VESVLPSLGSDFTICTSLIPAGLRIHFSSEIGGRKRGGGGRRRGKHLVHGPTLSTTLPTLPALTGGPTSSSVSKAAEVDMMLGGGGSFSHSC